METLRPLADVEIVPPYALEKNALGNDLLCVTGQHFQQIVLTLG
jgi:hypothetical protein